MAHTDNAVTSAEPRAARLRTRAALEPPEGAFVAGVDSAHRKRKVQFDFGLFN